MKCVCACVWVCVKRRMSEEPVDAKTAVELEALMKEFPDWKETYPDLYNTIQYHPPT